MTRRKSISIAVFLLLSFAHSRWHSGSSVADETTSPSQIIVRLKPNASVTDRIVLLEDVADVEGTDLQTIRRLQQLDLTEPPEANQMTSVSDSQVRVRLLLSGISANQFQVRGAEQCRISQQSPDKVDENTILKIVRREIAQQLRVADQDLLTRLLRPINLSADYSGISDDTFSIKPYLPEIIRPGTIAVRVAIQVDQRLREVASIMLEVRVYRMVARAARRIERDAYITEDDVVQERVALTDAALRQHALSAVGKQARRQFQPGEILYDRDLKEPPAPQDPIVVRPRDAVTLIAHKGGLTIKVNDAVALEAGRIGESIKVRNPRSNRIITGRIASRSIVEISF